jgi:CRP-like cAMP-binding protein
MTGDSKRARSPLSAKLSNFAPLSDDDVRTLDGLCRTEERFGAGADIVSEGDAPRSAFVLTHGMACRYRLLPDGRRQILTFLIPGDVSDLRVFLLKTMDHSIRTMVPTRLAAIGRETVIDIVARHPRIGAALSWGAMQEEAMLRERIVSLGRRNSRERLAYLLCELVWRHIAIGESESHAIWLPLTQTDLADALGLTAVHINRVLQSFRRDQLITLEHRRLVLLNVERLAAISGLTLNYLQLGTTPVEVVRDLDKLERDRARREPFQDVWRC